MLTVYGCPNTRSMRVTWLLEELGQDYHYQRVELSKGDGYSQDYRNINPAGKVPALADGGLLMTESGAIVTYLADKFSERGLIPAVGSRERARYEQWSYFACCELEQPLWTIGKNKFALPREQRTPEILAKAPWEFQRALELFSLGLGEQDFILGDSFSAADVLLGQTLLWAIAFKQAVEQDNVQAYVQRVMNRPALQRALERESAA